MKIKKEKIKMTKKEFLEKAGNNITVSDENFRIIDYVYQYHPSIQNNNVKGIEQMIDLYKNYGMALIKNMVYLANERRKLQNRMQDLKRDLENCQLEMNRMKEGDYPVQI